MEDMHKSTIPVLDHGYVRLVDSMGSDTTVVNSARVSYDKSVDDLSDRDVGLIKFLAKHDHTSPFRHAVLQFEVYAPLVVARQWYKYAVSSAHLESQNAWNESSRRYITEEPTFYVPKDGEWRSAPENSKQGSGSPLNEYEGKILTEWLIEHIEKGEDLYERAMKRGVAPEQARLFLPAYGMYVRWYWTASLQSVCHFLNQRLADDAQHEIAEYARAVYTLLKPHFSVSVSELVGE